MTATRSGMFGLPTTGILAAGVISLCLAPGISFAASSGTTARAVSAKAVSLRLADVVHVLGGGLTSGDAKASKPAAMGVCTSTPPATEYTTNFSGSLHTKGVLTVISVVYTFRSVRGPTCTQASDMSTYKLMGGTIGTVTAVRGVGEHAFLVDTTGPKSQGPQVFTLAIKFTRGMYRALIVVQSNQKIKVSNMVMLGKIVDGRMKHTR
jgi:hypothetical protein